MFRWTEPQGTVVFSWSFLPLPQALQTRSVPEIRWQPTLGQVLRGAATCRLRGNLVGSVSSPGGQTLLLGSSSFPQVTLYVFFAWGSDGKDLPSCYIM